MFIAQFFKVNPNFGGVQGHLGGLGERHDQHGHGLGSDLDLIYDHVIFKVHLVPQDGC